MLAKSKKGVRKNAGFGGFEKVTDSVYINLPLPLKSLVGPVKLFTTVEGPGTHIYVFVLGVRVQQAGVVPVCAVVAGTTHAALLKFSAKGIGSMHCASSEIVSRIAIRKLSAFISFLCYAKVTRLKGLKRYN